MRESLAVSRTSRTRDFHTHLAHCLSTCCTSSVDSFEFTAELGAFDSLGIRLVHGWLVDPDEREAVRDP